MLALKLANAWGVEGRNLCSNVYALGRNQITLIDTGSGRVKLESVLGSAGLLIERVAQVILTHCHFDHVGGLAGVLQKVSPRILACGRDALVIERDYDIYVQPVDEGSIVETEIGKLQVIRTPGHTEGSICLYHAPSRSLFSGDTVFADGSFGRVGFRDIDILKSLEKLARLQVRLLFPGHGPWVENGWHVKLALRNARLCLTPP